MAARTPRRTRARKGEGMSSFGMPGVGGSLGTCALCGDTFLIEVMVGSMLNKKVHPFTADGFDCTMYAHSECLKLINADGNIDVLALPEKSPIRQAFERAHSPKPSEGKEGR